MPSVTTTRLTNAFYIQSPRLQNALPVSRRNVLHGPRTSILSLSICSKHCLNVRLREIRRQEFFNGPSLLLKQIRNEQAVAQIGYLGRRAHPWIILQKRQHAFLKLECSAPPDVFGIPLNDPIGMEVESKGASSLAC